MELGGEGFRWRVSGIKKVFYRETIVSWPRIHNDNLILCINRTRTMLDQPRTRKHSHFKPVAVDSSIRWSGQIREPWSSTYRIMVIALSWQNATFLRKPHAPLTSSPRLGLESHKNSHPQTVRKTGNRDMNTLIFISLKALLLQRHLFSHRHDTFSHFRYFTRS